MAAWKSWRIAPAPIQVELSRLSRHHRGGLSRLRYRRSASCCPLDQQPFYTEKIVQLPDCYQVNDSTRAISRNDAGPRGSRACLTKASCSVASTTTTRSRRAVVRHLDAAPQRRPGQRALAAAGQRRRRAQSAQRGRSARRRSGAAGVCAAARRSRTISHGIASPISSLIRCPTTRTPPRAMRCGRDCRS